MNAIGEIWGVAVSRSGTRLASFGNDGTLVIWESGPEGFHISHEVEDIYDTGIYSCAWSANESHLSVTGHENSYKVVDVATG